MYPPIYLKNVKTHLSVLYYWTRSRNMDFTGLIYWTNQYLPLSKIVWVDNRSARNKLCIFCKIDCLCFVFFRLIDKSIVFSTPHHSNVISSIWHLLGTPIPPRELNRTISGLCFKILTAWQLCWSSNFNTEWLWILARIQSITYFVSMSLHVAIVTPVGIMMLCVYS